MMRPTSQQCCPCRQHTHNKRFFRMPLVMLLVMLTLIGTSTAALFAAPPHALLLEPQFTAETQHDGVFLVAPGVLTLDANAPSPPIAEQREGHYERYGFYISAATTIAAPAQTIQLTYDATITPGSALALDVRGSATGTRWTTWYTEQANGTLVTFDTPIRLVQYRARLFGSATTAPTLHRVTMLPMSSTPTYHIMSEQEPVAPTYRIHATRLGMVGGHTANGYIIEPNAWFAALPSWRALNSPGSYEYQVRITHGDKSVVVPVWDVGPWNSHDNYWDSEREQFNDLPRGWPEDHAAYFEGYNNGYAEKGFVYAPTAMDVSDGAWWALGLPDGRFEVDVTFLWLGADTVSEAAAPPPPDPSAAEFVVSDANQWYFHPEAHVCWYHSAYGCGEQGHAMWTLSTNNPNEHENNARWQPDLPYEAMFDVYVHVPICPNNNPITQSAVYTIQHRDGTEQVVINQAEQTGWVLLGRYPFAAGTAGSVMLTDITHDTMHAVWFDDVKWVPAP